MLATMINPDDYSIVWLSPLPIETAAALFMLDEHHHGAVNRQQGQTVEYHFGRIGQHNVAIAGFPSGEVGIGKAAAMAEAAVRDFKNLELGLLVGIAAAIPSEKHDIRHGDVAVADPAGNYPGVVDYDMLKVFPGGELQKQWMEATHPLWRSVISKIQARSTLSGHAFHEHLKAFDCPTGKKFQQPYDPVPLHSAFRNVRRQTDGPSVHYGTILSGNKVIRASEFRDRLKEKYGDAVAIEMEAAGVMTTLPVAVIRGISDSADPLKNDDWHARAAAVAAAYAKEMLLQLSPKASFNKIQETKNVARIRGQLPKSWDFCGREDQLKLIGMHLDPGNQKPFEKSVLVLSGLSGAGKSQLAAAYVKNQLSLNSARDIIWVNGRDRHAFKTDVAQLYQPEQIIRISTDTQLAEDTDKQASELVDSFLEELNRPGNTGWLMVVDDVTLWSSRHVSSQDSLDINIYLDRIHQGSILVTTNRQNWLVDHEIVLQIGGLEARAATELLTSKLRGHFVKHEELQELCRMLHGLPLSLRLAITYIRRRGVRVVDYINMWRERKLDDSLSVVDPALVHTMTLCFEELESRNATASKLLTLFGFLDHKNLSFDLCSKAESPDLPSWLLAVGEDRRLFDEVIEILVDLSFIQPNIDDAQAISYSIHPAVHAFARNRAATNKDEYVSWAVSLVTDNVPRSLENDYWRKARALASHADHCMAYIRAGSFQPQFLERIGALFRFLGRYDEASQLYIVVLQCMSPQREAFLETIAQVLNDLGLVYYGQRKFDMAVKTFRDSISSYSQLPGPLDGPSTDTLMCIFFNYGNACRMTQDLQTAEVAFNRVYDYFHHKSRQHGIHLAPWAEIIVARVLNALGELCLERNETQEAMKKFREALSLQKKHLEDAHSIILSTELNLGRAYTDLESYSDSCQIFKDLLEKYAEQLGMGHGQMMTDSQSSDNSAREAFKEAERLWLDNLSFYSERYGAGSEDALRTKANIALLQSITGELRMARRNMLQVFQRATKSAQKVKAQCDLALICQQMGDHEVAKINFSQAIDASMSLSEPSRTRELYRCMYHQARLYLSLGDQATYKRILSDLTARSPAEVNEWYERARSELGPTSGVATTSYSNLNVTPQLSQPPEQRGRTRKW
ncbi:hypothetical protein CLAIMM_03955 [Cladophialophora immunda]|nr:hypothetical protein CLAIMM_03955 [Cladophialophora immunda]